ncbi:MAG TPA: ATP-binding protein [Polyangia bacterium]|nr:ATP-binding protein [Polyangia bacterium]
MTASVLFVDDDASNLTVFEAACVDEFPVLTAPGGEQALALLRTNEVGVLLADQRMPGMTGVELAEKVRAEFPDIIRMIVTAYADLGAAIDAINRGQVQRYLKKPWEVRELKAALHEALDLYGMTRRVRELERRLVETERVYALGIVAAGIGHELRNPISWIHSNLGVVRDGLHELALDVSGQKVDPKRLAGRIREMEEELVDAVEGANRILEIASGIELASRVQDEDQEPIDPAEVVSLTLRMMQGELRRRTQLRLDTRRVPLVRASRTKLGQVVLNLLVNAVQALPDRPRNDNLITLRLLPDRGKVRLEVEDNGTGIPADYMPRIFDPFFTTKKHGGTGLGLAISRKIVEELGGQITVLSEAGQGARFVITLPGSPR